MNSLKAGLDDYNPVKIKGKDRFTNTLVLGMPGTGKSALISNWWKEDCLYKKAKVLIEPSGFLAIDAYGIARGKALYCSLETPISINPMQAPYDPNQISDNIAEAINQVIKLTTQNQELTVKMRSILDEAIKESLSKNRKSLISVLDYITNMKGSFETRDGLIHRLLFLLNDDRMRPILCGNDSIQWGEFIEKGQTFILDCYGMGSDKMIFIGTIISQGIKNYFRSTRKDKYPPLALYIDEFHNFINHNFFDILKEGRKYNIAAVLATQDLATIGKELSAVALNCGNLICFRVGYSEANMIAREMNMKPQELQFLEKYHLAYKTDNKVGVVKAPRPPLVRRLVPKARPQRKSGGWFPLESCQPEQPMN